MEKLVQQKKQPLKPRMAGMFNRKDLLLKIISLCLGSLLWYLVVGEDQVDISIQVPIEVLNLPDNLVISNKFKEELDVSIRGPRSIIQELRNRNISRPVDLSKAEPGAIVIKNDKDSIPLPRGITVLQLQPANITLSIDRLVQKTIPIHPVTEGEVSPGYKLRQITMDPNEIIVSGPQTVLNSALSLKTYVINLEGLNRSITLPVHLNLSPEFIDLIGETVVVAKIEVQEKIVSKKISKIPINVKDASRSVIVEPHTISVVAEIPASLIRDTPEPAMLFRAYVNAGDIQQPYDVPVVVNGVSVPGHGPITIKSHTPLKVRISPVQGSGSEEDKPQGM
jgi:YbbR domain-containing protein